MSYSLLVRMKVRDKNLGHRHFLHGNSTGLTILLYWVPSLFLGFLVACQIWQGVTLVPGSVVLAIRPERRKRNAWRNTIVSGSGHLYRPSKLHIKAHFPLMTGLVSTIFKAQGITLYQSGRSISLISHTKHCTWHFQGSSSPRRIFGCCWPALMKPSRTSASRQPEQSIVHAAIDCNGNKPYYYIRISLSNVFRRTCN